MRCTGYRSVDEAHVGTGGCLDRCVVPGIGVSMRLMWGLVGV